MKVGKISLLVLFIVLTLHVQANPSFKIIDGISNAATREVMEKNVNELITIINGAYEAKQKNSTFRKWPSYHLLSRKPWRKCGLRAACSFLMPKSMPLASNLSLGI